MQTAEAPSGISFVEFALIAGLLSGCVLNFAPEFAAATQSARKQALEEDLAMFRRQIARYRVDHEDRLPAHGTNSESAFVSQLSGRTNEHGEVSARAHFGPYILGGIPANPYSGESRVLVVAGRLRPKHADGNGTHGWAFSSTTGEIRANVRF